MRRSLLCLCLVACSASPTEVAEQALDAWEAHPAALPPLLDPEYRDSLGNGSRLLADLADWDARFAQRTLEVTDLHQGASVNELEKAVLGRFGLKLVGTPSLEASGTLRLAMRRRAEGFRVVDGLLADPRDILALLDARRAALEANDAEALRALLHPRYKDGLLDADEAIQRLSADLKGVALRLEPTRYWVELRGNEAHVDEHYRMRLDGREVPPGVARFTLGKSAGRWRFLGGLYGNGGNGALEPKGASD